MIVLPANPSPVTVNVKPFVFTVAPGSTVMLWTVTFWVSAGMTGSPAATYTLSVATGTPLGLQFFGFDQFVSTPFQNGQSPPASVGLIESTAPATSVGRWNPSRLTVNA